MGISRHVIGAGYGSQGWIIQRVTAVWMVVFTVLFLARYCYLGVEYYSQWMELFQPQWFRICAFLFFLSLSWHAWIGVRDIWMDYVRMAKLRLLLHSITVSVLIGYVIWVGAILWGSSLWVQ